ncbi:MAG: ABC transporter substrate-binding protein [Actinomycetota bacterium]
MRKFRSAALAGAVVLVLAACSDVSTTVPSSEPSPTTEAPAFPVTIGTGKYGVTIDEQPAAIVSLSPTATEMLFAIGAGDQVVAADEYSDYPAEAPTTDLSGYDPNVEAIVSFEPDLVILEGARGAVVDGLESLGIPALIQPAAASLEDTYAQMKDLGVATGYVDEATVTITAMRADIEGALAAVPDASGIRVYHELDDTYYSVTTDTFIGQVYAEFGMVNIADAAKGASSGYPQLSAEYIVKADPQLIVLADGDCCGQSAETVAARDGWGDIAAVRDGGLIVIDDSVASRWGPRIVEFIEAVSAGLQGLAT